MVGRGGLEGGGVLDDLMVDEISSHLGGFGCFASCASGWTVSSWIFGSASSSAKKREWKDSRFCGRM